MIITSRTEVFFNIEMTAEQVEDIHDFLVVNQTSDAAFMAVQELHGPERTDAIRETLVNLLMTLEGENNERQNP